MAALTQAQQTFSDQQAQVDRLAAERDAAQAKLDAARNWSAARRAARPAAAGPGPPGGRRRPAADWDRAPGRARPANGGNWDTRSGTPRCRTIPSAFVRGDPIAIINTVLGIAATSAQVTAQHGPQLPAEARHPRPRPPVITNGAIPGSTGGRPPST